MCDSFLKKVDSIRSKNWRAKARMEIYLKKNKKILLVEGALDKEIYSDVILRNNLDIEIIITGSKINYKTLKKTINEKTIYAIVDRDHDDAINDDTVFETPYYAIENYIMINNYWRKLIPSDVQDTFLDAVMHTNCKINMNDLREKILKKCSEIKNPTVIASDFNNRKIKDTIVRAIRSLNGCSSLMNILQKHDYEVFLNIISTKKMVSFLKKI